MQQYLGMLLHASAAGKSPVRLLLCMQLCVARGVIVSTSEAGTRVIHSTLNIHIAVRPCSAQSLTTAAIVFAVLLLSLPAAGAQHLLHRPGAAAAAGRQPGTDRAPGICGQVRRLLWFSAAAAAAAGAEAAATTVAATTAAAAARGQPGTDRAQGVGYQVRSCC
jgi:hypothetical protein